jgi:hypothetical protein
MMKAFTNKSSTSNVVLPNPALTEDELISMIKSKFKDGAVTLSLKDPGANMREEMNKAVIINTWVRSGNEIVTLDANDMGPTANLTRSQVLAAGFRKYGDGVDQRRVCLSYAIAGLIATAYSDTDNPSPPPLIIDLVPTHTQTEFNKKSGSARIDASNTDVVELIIQHVFAAYDHAFIKGWGNIKLIKKVIQKLGLVSMFLSDATISGVIDDYCSPQARYDLEDSLPVILVFNRETKKTTIIFACMQISSAIGGPKKSNRMSGKMYIPIIHELVCAFLDVSGAKNRTTAIPSFSTGDVSIFQRALYKVGAAKITKDLRLHGLLPESVEFLSPGQAGAQGAVCSVANQMKEKTGEMPTLKAAAYELVSRGIQGAVRSVANQMELETREMPTLKAAASELGSTSGRKSVGKPKGNAVWAKVVQISGSDEEIQGTEKCADKK